jgi:hypothetical protein
VLTELIRLKHLDGISPAPIDLEQREEYFQKIKTRILDMVQVDIAEFPPVDLAYLCTLVSGITGLGLSWYHDAQQSDFISPIRDAQQLEKMLKAVAVPICSDGSSSPSKPTDLDVTDDLLMGIWGIGRFWLSSISAPVYAGAALMLCVAILEV